MSSKDYGLAVVIVSSQVKVYLFMNLVHDYDLLVVVVLVRAGCLYQ